MTVWGYGGDQLTMLTLPEFLEVRLEMKWEMAPALYSVDGIFKLQD